MMLEKQPYYVNVETGEVHSDKTASSFQFEIEATAEDASRLTKLFRECDESATDTFLRSHVPYVPYHNDADNHRYDQTLKDIYQFIHDHGQPLTKEHIESMGILGERQ
ncbi:hydrolase [Fictibacillus sp. KU28468]|uniref:hydrolase n=1 Tax=Fictibacillus sp. KU28468 TaxID=2991053 RepID=UPI00223DCA2D|nr:hydrolase [Fictibacillus sp. KU28468]UZJ77489.1 hydrolase [Fictibacillus sp. KU28468]